MKKLIALLMIVSFVMVSTGSAFAEPRDFERNGVVTKRIERRHDRRPAINRQAPIRRNEATRMQRPNRPEPGNRIMRNRAHPNNEHNRYQRPIIRNNGGFFNRVGRYPSYPNYDSRPYHSYRNHNHYRSGRSSSITPLEFLGIGAVLLTIAAMVSDSSNNNYDYDY